MSGRNAAALFLLTADEELWQRVLWHFDSSGFDFPAIRLSGIHPELYSIYQAAKTISVGGDNIVIEDLAFPSWSVTELSGSSSEHFCCAGMARWS